MMHTLRAAFSPHFMNFGKAQPGRKINQNESAANQFAIELLLFRLTIMSFFLVPTSPLLTISITQNTVINFEIFKSTEYFFSHTQQVES